MSSQNPASLLPFGVGEGVGLVQRPLFHRAELERHVCMQVALIRPIARLQTLLRMCAASPPPPRPSASL